MSDVTFADVLFGIRATFEIATIMALFCTGMWYLPKRDQFTKGVVLLGLAVLLQKAVLLWEVMKP